MNKIKNILIKIFDFIIGIIVFYSSIIGISKFLKELFGYTETNSFCGILAILLFARFIYLINTNNKGDL